jgi:hypothetical protein
MARTNYEIKGNRIIVRLVDVEDRIYTPEARWSASDGDWEIHSGCRKFLRPLALRHWEPRRYVKEGVCSVGFSCEICREDRPRQRSRAKRYCEAIRALPKRPSAGAFKMLAEHQRDLKKARAKRRKA